MTGKPESVQYAVLVLERVTDDRTEEHRAECLTFEEALTRCSQAAQALPLWVAMTIVHASDYGKVRDKAAVLEPAVSTDMVRDVLVALCERAGIPLESSADPGTPARNFELAERLGIGEVFR